MPNLHQTLRSTDLDFLQRIARLWRIDLESKSFATALEETEKKLTERELFQEIIESLPPDAQTGWTYLLEHKGKTTWSLFTRQFGEVRAFGPAKRERIAPDLNPISASESLWYRGLVGRAFLALSGEPQEYIYIPDEFMGFVQVQKASETIPQPRPATAAETRISLKANDHILDDATEILAALRMGRPLLKSNRANAPAYEKFLTALLTSSTLLTSDRIPDPAHLKKFLAAERSDALLTLYQNWSHTRDLNDLRMLPGLIFEGNWTNDPIQPRELLVQIFKQLDPSVWWSTNSLLAQIKETQPDFQRSAGDYDSWFIRDGKTETHLQGVKNWDKIEGSLIRYLIAGPFHWLGAIDLAFSEKNTRPQAFRISNIGSDLFRGSAPTTSTIEDGLITLSNDDTLHVPQNAPRAIRYQIARFGQPVKQTPTEIHYRISPTSLRTASGQGLLTSHLLQLLQQAKVKTIPPSFVQQLDRWDKYGVEAVVTQTILLRLSRPEILPLLQNNPRAARCLGEVLNPKTIVIKPGCIDNLRQALAEMGFLADIQLDGEV